MSDIDASISVAMISRNEEAAVGRVIADIQGAVPGAEIVLVDSSTDKTAEIAERAGARVIRQVPPRGYGPAMQAADAASAPRALANRTAFGCPVSRALAGVPEITLEASLAK